MHDNLDLQIRVHSSSLEKGFTLSRLVEEVEEFKYLWVFLPSERKMREIDKQIGVICRPAFAVLICRSEAVARPKGEALHLQVDLHSYPKLWS